MKSIEPSLVWEDGIMTTNPKKLQNDILSIISGNSNYRKNGRKINEIMINISGK
jgi:hypothetical protein